MAEQIIVNDPKQLSQLVDMLKENYATLHSAMNQSVRTPAIERPEQRKAVLLQ